MLEQEAIEQANARHNRKPDLAVRARLESPSHKPEPIVVKPARVFSVEDGLKIGERLMHHRGKSPIELAATEQKQAAFGASGATTSRSRKELYSGATTSRSTKTMTKRQRSDDTKRRHKPSREDVVTAVKSASRYNHKRAMSTLLTITSSPSQGLLAVPSNLDSKLASTIKSELDSPNEFLSIETQLRTPQARTSLDSTKPSVSSVRGVSPLQYLGWKTDIKNFEKLKLPRA